MPEITPEQRKAAEAVMAEVMAGLGWDGRAWRNEAGLALEALIAEGWGPVADAEAERDAAVAKFEANDGIHGAACAMIRDLLNMSDVPKAAFIDDHVANAIVERNIARDELAAAKERIAEQESLLADAEARGYRAGIEAAARACDAVACDDKGFGEGGRDAARCCSNRIRWLIYHDKPKETPHG